MKIEELNKNEKKKDIEKIRSQMIGDILAGKHNFEDNSKLANYHAIFEENKEPYLINIWSLNNGLGYVIFHDFLIKVGQGHIFSSTDFEPAGEKLFQKAINDGLIEQFSEKSGMSNITRWKVIGDPKENLKRLKEELS